MTLAQVLQWIGEHPGIVAGYFTLLPVSTWLIGESDSDRGHTAPWKYLYMIILYLVAIPGLFALFLTIWLTLFEGRSILDIDLLTQILPIVSMILTLYMITRQVDVDAIPGSGRLTGFLMIASSLLVLFWMLDKMRIVAFTHFPFHYLVLLFVGLLFIVVVGISRLRG